MLNSLKLQCSGNLTIAFLNKLRHWVFLDKLLQNLKACSKDVTSLSYNYVTLKTGTFLFSCYKSDKIFCFHSQQLGPSKLGFNIQVEFSQLTRLLTAYERF